MIKRVTHVHLGSIWYQSEPLEFPYCPNQFLGFDFLAVFYSKPALAGKHPSMEFTFNEIIVDQKNCRKKVCSVHVENTCRTAEAKRMIKAYNKKKPNSQLVEILFEQAFIFLCMLGVY